MKPERHVVSVSLGSSSGDHRVETVLLGHPFVIERIGTNGDYPLFCRKIRELDGKADAIGIGGINLALVAGRRRYYIRDAVRAVAGMHTPVVDGGGIKDSWERYLIRQLLPEEYGITLRGRRVLLVASVDRYGMAEALAEVGADLVFGDLMFGLGIPIGLRGLGTIRVLAAILLPVLTRGPFTWLYPTGKKQDQVTPKFSSAYQWAEVLAGDSHLIQRFMPEDLSGKTIITNTITRAGVEALRKRHAALLVTTTPEMDGRSFATNVLEAIVVALSGLPPQHLGPADYLEWIRRAGLKPRVERLA